MTQKSISRELTELFDLHKTGALTRDEYELLKVHILQNNECVQVEEYSDVSLHYSKSNGINEHQPDERNIGSIDSGKSSVKRISTILIATAIIILISFKFQETNTSKEEKIATQYKKTKLKVEGTIKSEKNQPIKENEIVVWDEAYATNIVMGELEKYKGWSNFLPSNSDSIALVHDIYGFFKIAVNNKVLWIGVVASNSEDNNCNVCDEIISFFEFENKDGWQLTNKSIACIIDKPVVVTLKVQGIQLSSNNYGLLTSFSRLNYENSFIMSEIYTFINKELIKVFSTSHSYDSSTSYSVKLKTAKKEGYYYLGVKEWEKTEGRDEIVTITAYKFNGSEYVEIEGSITNPLLTSTNRFVDINSINKRKNNICTSCNGTGIQTCKLCGGTGVSNMGIECNCIRTYKMELAAGHTPSHKPLKWTCISCKGTGKYNN